MKRLKSLFITAALLALIMLGSGCTMALWQNDIVDPWNEPATESHVCLFQSQPPEKILVVYTEHSGRRNAMRQQAYWLDEKHPEQQHAPHFVSPNSSAGLTAIPVFPSLPEPPSVPPAYAVVAPDGQSFSLYSNETKTTSYHLPSYYDSTGELEKVLLTPAAVTCDLTIIGGVIGYFYLEGEASDYNPSY